MAYGDGSVFKRSDSPNFWIKYFVDGKAKREVGGKTEAEARKQLRKRLGEVAAGTFCESDPLVSELVADWLRSLASKGKAQPVLTQMLDRFGRTKASRLTAKAMRLFQEEKIAEGYSAQTVDHWLTYTRAAFNFARKEGTLSASRVPHFPLLHQDNRRSGFIERPEFDRVVANLPGYIAAAARFAFLSGWRRGEIVSLRWELVDRAAGEVRLHTSKNGKPRTLPLVGALAELIEERWALRQYEMHGTTKLSPLVFHRNGERLGDFRKAWATACEKAGVPALLFHDLRRSAVRDLIRAGVPQSVAMSISGHRTVSVFNRYDISDDADRREALAKLDEHRASKTTSKLGRIGQ